MNKENNSIATTFKVLGWISVIIFFIVGIPYSINAEDLIEASGTAALFTMWGIGLGTLLSCLAFAELIQILHDIRKKLYFPTNRKKDS